MNHACSHPRPAASVLLFAVGLSPLLVAAALGQTNVIDDFAANHLASAYVFKVGSDSNWNVTGGQLVPTLDNGYTAIAATDYSLRNVGDWITIEIRLDQTVVGANGGLSVWRTATGNANPTTDRIFEPRLSFEGGLFNAFKLESEVGTTYLNGTPTLANLKVEFTDLQGSTANLTATLSGSVFSPVAQNFSFAWDGSPMFVGPSAWLASGANLTFDNFTTNTSMSAVPEPSTYATLAGAAALAFALWRRRRSPDSLMSNS